MWSIRYKTVSRRQGDITSECRVCKQKTTKMHVTEKKVLFILYLIPIPLKKEYVDICSGCKARARVAFNPELIDS